MLLKTIQKKWSDLRNEVSLAKATSEIPFYPNGITHIKGMQKNMHKNYLQQLKIYILTRILAKRRKCINLVYLLLKD